MSRHFYREACLHVATMTRPHRTNEATFHTHSHTDTDFAFSTRESNMLKHLQPESVVDHKNSLFARGTHPYLTCHPHLVSLMTGVAPARAKGLDGGLIAVSVCVFNITPNTHSALLQWASVCAIEFGARWRVERGHHRAPGGASRLSAADVNIRNSVMKRHQLTGPPELRDGPQSTERFCVIRVRVKYCHWPHAIIYWQLQLSARYEHK